MIKNKNEIIITEEESKCCRLDNKKFESSRKMIWYVKKTYNLTFEQYIIKSYYNDIRPVCLKTGTSLKFKANKLGPWFSNYSKNNFPRKNHTSETIKKIKHNTKKSIKEKYGTDNVFSTNWCKEKIKITNLEKYGVENYMQSEEAKQLFSTFVKSEDSISKTKNTNLEKYGKDHLFKTDEYKKELRLKIIDRFYNGDFELYKNKMIDSFDIKCESEYDDLIECKDLKFKCLSCENTWEEKHLLITYCEKCNDQFKNCRSLLEKNISSWLNSKIKIENNKRFTYDGVTYEADILVPDKKLIIEINGLYWHSEVGGNKDRKYHINKLKFFNDLGYEVINIFEDEWMFKSNIIKSKILHKLNLNKYEIIHARKCKIKKIKNSQCEKFLNENHIQGNVNASLCYGAYFDDTLVSVMTFSKQRKMMNKRNEMDTYELVRFAVHGSYLISGISNKLLKQFILDINPKKIISYADRRWSSEKSNIYQKLNFKLNSYTPPNYWYVKKLSREYRYKYTKQKLINEGFDPNLTEWQIMKNRGYDRIWDCGHLKYEICI